MTDKIGINFQVVVHMCRGLHQISQINLEKIADDPLIHTPKSTSHLSSHVLVPHAPQSKYHENFNIIIFNMSLLTIKKVIVVTKTGFRICTKEGPPSLSSDIEEIQDYSKCIEENHKKWNDVHDSA